MSADTRVRYERRRADDHLDVLLQRVRTSLGQFDAGEPASYIPELGRVDAGIFGISLRTLDGRVHSSGDARTGPSTLIVDTSTLDLESRRGVPGGDLQVFG